MPNNSSMEEAHSLKEILDFLQGKDMSKVNKGMSMLEKYLLTEDVAQETLSEALLETLNDMLNNANIKVVKSALQCMDVVLDQLGSLVKPQLQPLLDTLIERLADKQDTIRDSGTNLLLKLMQSFTPQYIYDKIRPALSHRNAYVREGVLSLFVQAMEIYGGDSISFVVLLPHVVRRLEDRDASVREMTLEVLECMYKYTGEELVSHIQQTNLIENHKLQPILTRFNDIAVVPHEQRVPLHPKKPKARNSTGRKSGTLTPLEVSSVLAEERKGRDTEERVTSKSRESSTSSLRAKTPSGGGGGGLLSSTSVGSNVSSGSLSARRPASARVHRDSQVSEDASDGGNDNSLGSTVVVNKQGTLKKTLNRPVTARAPVSGRRGSTISGAEISLELPGTLKPIRVTNERELQTHMDRIATIIKDTNSDTWEKRIAALHSVCALLLGGANEYPSFLTYLKKLKDGLRTQVTELRSAVCKEACATLVFLSKELKNDFTEFADYFIPLLLNLTVVTVWIIAQSGTVCIRSIIANTRLKRCIKFLGDALKTNKNPILRARAGEYMVQLLEVEETAYLEKSVDVLEDAVITALQDGNEEVRAAGRSMYFIYKRHFGGDRCRRILESVGPKVVKYLQQQEDEMGVDPDEEDKKGQSTGKSGGKRLVSGATMSSASSKRSSRASSPVRDKPARGSASETVSPTSTQTKSRVQSGTLAGGALRGLNNNNNALARTGPMRVDPVSKRPVAGHSSSNSVDSGFVAGKKPGAGRMIRQSSDKIQVPSKVVKPPPVPAKNGTMKPGSGTTRLPRSTSDGSTLLAGMDLEREFSSTPKGNTHRKAGSMHTSSSSTNLGARSVPSVTPSRTPKDFDSRTPKSAGSRTPKTEEDRYMRQGQRSSGSYDDMGFDTASLEDDNLVSLTPKKARASSPSADANNRLAELKRGERMAEAAAAHAAAMALDEKGASPTHAQFSGGDDYSDSSGTVYFPGAHAKSIKTITQQLIHADADERMSGLDKLETILKDRGAIPDILVKLEVLIDIMGERIADVSYKVAERALQVLLVFIGAVKLKIVPYLLKLVPVLFLRLADTRPTIQKASNAVLLRISAEFGADKIYPVVLQVLSMDSAKVLLVCVEYLHHLLSTQPPGTSQYLQEFLNIKDFVHRLYPFIINKSNARLRQISASIYASLVAHNPHSSYMALLTLPRNILDQVIDPLENLIPRLQENLIKASREEASRTGSASYSPLKSISNAPDAPLSPSRLLNSASQDSFLTENKGPYSPSRYEDRLNGTGGSSHSRSSSFTFNMPPLPADGGVPPLPRPGPAGSPHSSNSSPSITQQRKEAISGGGSDSLLLAIRPSNGVMPSGDILAELRAEGGLGDIDNELTDVNLAEVDPQKLATQLGDTSDNTGATRMRAVKLLRKLARAFQTNSLLANNFLLLAAPLLECLEDARVSIKEQAAQAAYELVRIYPRKLLDGPTAELFTIHLLEFFRTAPKSLHALNEKALFKLGDAVEPKRIYNVLVTCAEAENKNPNNSVRTVHSNSLRLLGKLIERMDMQELGNELPKMIPCLSDGMGNQNAVIRKDAVLCFVAAHTVLGNTLSKHLASLNMSQTKLIQIYIDRAVASQKRGSYTQAMSPRSEGSVSPSVNNGSSNGGSLPSRSSRSNSDVLEGVTHLPSLDTFNSTLLPISSNGSAGAGNGRSDDVVSY